MPREPDKGLYIPSVPVPPEGPFMHQKEGGKREGNRPARPTSLRQAPPNPTILAVLWQVGSSRAPQCSPPTIHPSIHCRLPLINNINRPVQDNLPSSSLTNSLSHFALGWNQRARLARFSTSPINITTTNTNASLLTTDTMAKNTKRIAKVQYTPPLTSSPHVVL